MQKKVLTEVDLYTGEIQMPKGFDIDRDKIRNDIIAVSYTHLPSPRDRQKSRMPSSA